MVSTGKAQLPQELWDYAKTDTYMYFPQPIKQTSHFHIQTNNHFFSFNFNEFKLEQFRFISDKEIGKDRLEAKNQNIDDLLNLYLVYGEKKYKVVRNEADKNYAGELIESGKFFQRRYYSELKLENGPDFKFALEIASWTDAVTFKLLHDEANAPKDKMELVIEMKLPKSEYSKVKQEKKAVIAKKSKNKAWHIKTNGSNGKITLKKDIVTVSAPIQEKSVDLCLSATEFTNRGLIITATDKKNVNKALEIKQDASMQAKVISLTGNFNARFGLERTKLELENTTNDTKFERLIFEKLKGVRDITGLSVMFRDKEGNPTGIPIQISKNWHAKDKSFKYRGPWLRAYTVVALPPQTKVELELTRATGFWGTLPAVSHAQLCLSGWGKKFAGNHQLWEQTAMGAFGESICYEPDGGQASTLITDVRPLFVKSTNKDIVEPQKWNWTPNVGGGDFMRVYDEKGKKKYITRIKAKYTRNCPNLTEVTYNGTTSKGEANYALTSHIFRNDDYVRAYYHLVIDVKSNLKYSRLALAQFGSQTYTYTQEKKIAYGNEKGFIEEINRTYNKDEYIKKDITIEGVAPWFSMHEAVNLEPKKYGTWGNRGVVLRDWKATVGGKSIQPRFSIYSAKKTRAVVPVNLVEVNLPSNIKELNKGDKIEMVLELCVVPQEAESYYGSNTAFKNFLDNTADTWKPIYRESSQNTLKVDVIKGKIVRQYPLMIEAKNNEVVADLSNGLAYVPLTISNIKDYKNFKVKLTKEGEPISFDQEKFGKDYWQTDYDAQTKTWQITYSVPMDNDTVK